MNGPSLSFRSNFDSSVPENVQAALVGTVRAAHDIATSFCFAEFDPPEARDLMPHLKRAYVERGLTYLPDRFPDIVRVVSKLNAVDNSARVLQCGRVCMTASFLSHDQSVPRPAVFRNQLARDYNQLLLQPEEEQERIHKLRRAMTEIYAILCHRSSRSGEVSGVSIVFVDDRCHYITEIDLIACTASREGEIEVVNDEVRTQLRGDLVRRLREQF